jgi:tRNA nucleotidyltransferase/poly(A) polymerase
VALISHSNLSRKILSEIINKWIFDNTGTNIFLVGGYLRDVLLGRRSMDIDYVVDGNPLEAAKETARRFKGTLIIFKGPVFRVVLPDRVIVDFTPIRGTIHDDLMLRDFTINAMAWSPEGGIIDPSGGIKDLEKGIIRVLFPKNLEDDPLRVLRAYRHAAELSFAIDRDTSVLLKQNASGLKRVSAERITYELFRTLNQKECYRYIRKSFDDGVLHEVVKLKKERLRANLRILKKFEDFISHNGKRIDRFFKKRGSAEFLKDELNQGLERDGLIKLFLILKDHRTNQKTGLLRLSRNIRKAIRSFSQGLELLNGRITDEHLYEIFSASGEHVYEMSIIISMSHEKRLEEFLRRADDFIRLRRKPLLNGDEIKEILRCSRGITIGKARAFLNKAQFLGQIRTKKSAKKLLLANFT